MQTIVINVSGHVQGVYYRQSTRAKALELGITGTVRNLVDGKVQIMATGSKGQLDKLLEWCKEGPPRAAVTHVEWQDAPLKNFNDFKVER